jgi:hypothetical protein
MLKAIYLLRDTGEFLKIRHLFRLSVDSKCPLPYLLKDPLHLIPSQLNPISNFIYQCFMTHFNIKFPYITSLVVGYIRRLRCPSIHFMIILKWFLRNTMWTCEANWSVSEMGPILVFCQKINNLGGETHRNSLKPAVWLQTFLKRPLSPIYLDG